MPENFTSPPVALFVIELVFVLIFWALKKIYDVF